MNPSATTEQTQQHNPEALARHTHPPQRLVMANMHMNQIMGIVPRHADMPKHGGLDKPLRRCLMKMVHLALWRKRRLLRSLSSPSMAYASLAGLPAINGLYSSLTPLIVYGLLGSSGQLAVGPTAIHAIITAEYILGELTTRGMMCVRT